MSMQPPPSGPPSGPVSGSAPLSPTAAKFKRLTDAVVDFGGERPWVVLAIAMLLLLGCWRYAARLDVRSDVMELLPRDSPGFQAFERQLERVGGRATLVVVCESPDRKANERFVDDVTTRVQALADGHTECVTKCTTDACRKACGPELIAFLESNTKDMRAFFESKKWLYAELKDLEEADGTLDNQIAIKSGLVEDLDEDERKGEKSLGMEKFKERWENKAHERDDFPTGYFANKDGTQMAMRIVSTAAGMGGSTDDLLLREVEKIVADMKPAETYHPGMKVGFGGDIPNAAAEKESLVAEAITATAIAGALILGGLVWFYRSLWALVLIAFPPMLGVGCAYAFATWKYGYVNSSGAFLGAIVLGNGINYPIVLYSRYREFRGRGIAPPEARRSAVWNAFRAELVGSTVASIAYGSLTVTRFRGFSQFGTIGFVGMLLVWITMIPCLPAMIVLIERLHARVPWMAKERLLKVAPDGSRGPASRLIGDLTERAPWAFVVGATLISLIALVKLPAFLHDPWEYDFDRLSSKGSQTSGAAQWSAKADSFMHGKMNLAGALVVADTPEQVPLVKEKILERDRAAAATGGTVVDSITTIQDFLPGDVALQKKKLEVLDRMRERMTPAVLHSLSEEEQKTVREMTPPADLAPVEPKDLPLLLKRRFTERDGTLGTVFYLKYRAGVSLNDGHNLLRIASIVDDVVLPDGTKVHTASRSTVFAEMIRSLERDGPLATAVSFFAVMLVVLRATATRIGATAVLLSLVLGVLWTVGAAALLNEKLNFLNFIALPITFGIGSEYPFNIYDRSRLLAGDVTRATKLQMGPVVLCSYTTTIGYGSLLFADNQALQSFGRLAIGGEIACVLGAVLFLPALLHLLQRRARRGESV